MGYLIGVDLGGTNIKAGVVNPEGKTVEKLSIKTNAERPMEDIIADMGQIALDVTAACNLNISDISAIGVGSPGTPDNRSGVLVYATNLPFRMAPIRSVIGKMTGLPVYIDNDANCAAMAESVVGAAQGIADSVTITLGTGIGAGIIINHRIYSGFNQAGSEFGHTVLVSDGVLCSCGRKGCFESYGSATGLIRMTGEAAAQDSSSILNRLIKEKNGKISAKTAFEAMREGDRTATDVVDRYLEYLADGLANVVNAFMPEVLVIGGGVCNEGDALLIPLLSKMEGKTFFGPGVRKTEVRLAKLGNGAGIVGAAMMAKACLEDGLSG
ncbi:MAG: ROK family protein [Oscillospiraceae bacterium]|nr:ROK family protein [Oscillospiraceae bacterium]